MRWAEYMACIGRRYMHTGFWWGNMNERLHERPMYRWEGIDCIYLAADRDKRQAVTDTIIDLCIL
jgi:hypothetical protein